MFSASVRDDEGLSGEGPSVPNAVAEPVLRLMFPAVRPPPAKPDAVNHEQVLRGGRAVAVVQLLEAKVKGLHKCGSAWTVIVV